LFALTRKDFFFLYLGISPQARVQSRKFGKNAGLGKLNVQENSLCTPEYCCQLFSIYNPAKVAIKFSP
jgi:hypothetical protein